MGIRDLRAAVVYFRNELAEYTEKLTKTKELLSELKHSVRQRVYGRTVCEALTILERYVCFEATAPNKRSS